MTNGTEQEDIPSDPLIDAKASTVTRYLLAAIHAEKAASGYETEPNEAWERQLIENEAWIRRWTANYEDRHKRVFHLFFHLALKHRLSDDAERAVAEADRELLEARLYRAANELALTLERARLSAGTIKDTPIELDAWPSALAIWREERNRLSAGTIKDKDTLIELDGWCLLSHAWPSILAAWREERKIQIGARRVLDAADSSRLDGLDRGQVEDRLTEKLRLDLRLAETATKAPTTDDATAESLRLHADPGTGRQRYERAELTAQWTVARYGETGKTCAADLRAAADAKWAQIGTPDAPHPWQAWAQPAHLAHIIGRCLLYECVLPQLRREREERSQIEALTSYAAERIVQATLPGMRLDDDGVLVNPEGERLATLHTTALALETAEALVRVREGVALFSGLGMPRLVFWELESARKQAETNARDARLCPEPHALEHDGGWEEIEDLSGVERKEARRLAYAQAFLLWPLPNNEQGNLIVLTEGRGYRGRRARVRIELGAAMRYDLGGLVYRLPCSPQVRAGKRLVPVLDPDTLALVGRRNDPAAQVNFAQRIVIEMRRRPAELVSGAVHLPAGERQRIANGAHLKPALLPGVMRALIAGSDARPPLLTETAQDHFTLAPERRPALELMVVGAREELAGREMGRLGARKKRARLNGSHKHR